MADEAAEQANRAGMTPGRLVVIFYLGAGVVTALFLGKLLGLLWAELGLGDHRVLGASEDQGHLQRGDLRADEGHLALLGVVADLRRVGCGGLAGLGVRALRARHGGLQADCGLAAHAVGEAVMAIADAKKWFV